jgi:hypothetical protein
MRCLTAEEKALIVAMVRGRAAERAILQAIDEALVEEMEDGGMGSLHFVRPASSQSRFGKQLCEATCHDQDGTPVSIALQLDQFGCLFELDIFKADFSPLKKLPSPSDLQFR